MYAAVAQELALLETQLNDAANTNGEAEAMVLEACMRQETPEIRRTALGILDKWAPGVYPRDPGGVGHRDGRPVPQVRKDASCKHFRPCEGGEHNTNP